MHVKGPPSPLGQNVSGLASLHEGVVSTHYPNKPRPILSGEREGAVGQGHRRYD